MLSIKCVLLRCIVSVGEETGGERGSISGPSGMLPKSGSCGLDL